MDTSMSQDCSVSDYSNAPGNAELHADLSAAAVIYEKYRLGKLGITPTVMKHIEAYEISRAAFFDDSLALLKLCTPSKSPEDHPQWHPVIHDSLDEIVSNSLDDDCRPPAPSFNDHDVTMVDQESGEKPSVGLLHAAADSIAEQADEMLTLTEPAAECLDEEEDIAEIAIGAQQDVIMDDLEKLFLDKDQPKKAIGGLRAAMLRDVPQYKVAAGGGGDDPKRVFIICSYSGYGLNQQFLVNSKNPAEIKRGQAIVAKRLADGPLIIKNILGFVPKPAQYRFFILDGNQGNLPFERLKQLNSRHIPAGSKASELMDAYATFKPTDVIIIGQRGDGVAIKPMLKKHTMLKDVVPDCQFHYLANWRHEQITLPPLTSAMIVDAIKGDPKADKEALALIKVVRDQSWARHMLSVAYDHMGIKGGSITRNQLGLKAEHGVRKSLAYAMNMDAWPEPQSCKDLLKPELFKNGCVPINGCSVMIAGDSELSSHLYAHHINPDDPYECVVCGKTFRSGGSLRTHIGREGSITERPCEHPAGMSMQASG